MEEYLKELLLKHHVLKLVGPINLNSHEYFEESLSLAREKGFKKLTLEIASPGGVAPVARYIFDLISNFPGEITGIVKPHAHSGASQILQACHKRLALQTSTFVYHRPLNAKITLKSAAANENEIIRTEAWVNKIFTRRSNLSLKEFEELNDADIIISASQALRMGLIDKIIKPPDKKKKTTASQKTKPEIIEINNDNLNSIFDKLDRLRVQGNPDIQVNLLPVEPDDYQKILQIYETLIFYEGHITTQVSKGDLAIPLILLLAGNIRQVFYNVGLVIKEPYANCRYSYITNHLAKKLLLERLQEMNSFLKNIIISKTKIKSKQFEEFLQKGMAIKAYDFKRLGIANEIIIPAHLCK